MTLKTWLTGTAAAVLLTAALPAVQASAQEIYFPLLSYRTGPFASSGVPIANGMHDYLRMLNERDGGIGGVRLNIEECETGYDTKKGVECYEAVKGKNPALINPYSTGITLQLIRKRRSTRCRSCRWPMASRLRLTARISRGCLFRR